MKRREFVLLGTTCVAAGPALATGSPTIKVAKTATCGCCSAWVLHVQEAGFSVDAQNVDQDDLYALKDRLGITPELSGCHTALVDGYFVEGHVPASDIARLLDQRPDALGLTVPGMPMSSPGMAGPGAGDTFETLLVAKDGSTSIFARHS